MTLITHTYIYSAIDKSHLSLLAWFEVAAPFDMVDHQILLERLETSCGVSSLPLLWIKSYLSDRTQMIVSGESRTSWVPIFLGVPQGSVSLFVPRTRTTMAMSRSF